MTNRRASWRHKWTARAAAGVAAAALCLPAFAQLIDPTRPPQAIDTGTGTAAGEGNESVLQSVLISAGHRAAIIGGQLVELGQKYGEATLTRVAEGEVTLTQGKEVQVLRLFPGVDKREARTEPAATPKAGAAAPRKPKGKKQK